MVTFTAKIPLISVVIPVYNVASYINEAIGSILNQTIQDFEIIVIDDASTDGTVGIVRAIKDERIKILTKEQNKGLIDSLNIGFEMATGQFIARMDGDDISVRNRFEKQLSVLQQNPHIMACGCWLQSFGAYADVIRHSEKHEEIQSRLLISNPMSLGATMLNRKAYAKFRFDPDKEHVEDYDFWARSGWNCRMHNIQEVLYHYRVHGTQVSQKYKAIQLQGDIGIKLLLFKKLQYDSHRFPDELISKVLYANESATLTEWQLIFHWFMIVLSQNKKLNVFDGLALKKVIFEIRKKLLHDIFFNSNRKGMDYDLRKRILMILPLNEQLFILKKKIQEKLKKLQK